MVGWQYMVYAMPKFFVSPDCIRNNNVLISGDNAHHLIYALRTKIKDKVIICDGANNDFYCLIEKININESSLIASIYDKALCNTEPPIKIMLYQSLPKNNKFEFTVQKCVELGIYAITPIITKYTNVKKNDMQIKEKRYNKIAESAAGQSMRGIIPAIHPVMQFNDALELMATIDGYRLFADERESKQSIGSIFNGAKRRDVSIWVGPEGGFSEEEKHKLQLLGVLPFTLGPRILRTETAGMAALIHVLNIWEV